jgi:hypothetical protein
LSQNNSTVYKPGSGDGHRWWASLPVPPPADCELCLPDHVGPDPAYLARRDCPLCKRTLGGR